MTLPISGEMFAMMADVLDAIDPTRPDDARLDAAQRAASVQPVLALWTAARLAGGMISASSDPAAMMAALRRGVASEHRGGQL